MFLMIDIPTVFSCEDQLLGPLMVTILLDAKSGPKVTGRYGSLCVEEFAAIACLLTNMNRT